MQKTTLNLFIAAITIMLLSPARSYASHAAGGEIVYEWISDSTYRFFFKFYRDCSGIAESQTQELCANPTPVTMSSCTTGLTSFTTTMNQWTGPITGGAANGSEVYSGCPGFPTKCQDTASTIPGYREWWYSAIITLPGKCNYWTFSTDVSARNSSVNLASPGTMYAETTFDNLNFQGNSSPYFFVKPIFYIPLNIPYMYSNGALDINNDSLVTELVMPQNTSNGCPASFSPTGLNTGYNLTNNPFACGNSFTLNPLTGQMSFTATTVGQYGFATRVKEYRGGNLVGYISRDIQTGIINFTPASVSAALVQSSLVNAIYNNNIIYTTNHLQLSFCFYVKASVPGTVLVVYDNSGIVFPGSSVTYTNTHTDSVRGCFTWTPALTDTGIRAFTILVKDSSCSGGIPAYHSFTYLVSLDTLPVSVKNIPAANKGTVVYPNPAQQQLTVKTPVHYTTAFITNSMGQLLLQQKLKADKTVDISSLPKGLYYLKLENNREETETLKFSKE
jgi:hypothetical protein